MSAIKKLKMLDIARVRYRLKIGGVVLAVFVLLCVTFKVGHDVGYYHSHALTVSPDNLALLPSSEISLREAQSIVSGALKEDGLNPKTVVDKILDSNNKLLSIVVLKEGRREIAWVLNRRFYFSGDLYSSDGYNVTDGLVKQYIYPGH